MRASSRLMSLGLGLAFALTAGVAPARAGLVATVTETTSSVGGLTRYTYVVTDAVTSTDNIGEFDMAVPVGANLTSFNMPTGFIDVYTTGFSGLSFESTASSTDLAPGQSGTFSFLSTNGPGVANYAFTDYNTGDMAIGSVVAPATVPEPGSLVLLGVGLFSAGAMLARRRSRKRAGSPA